MISISASFLAGGTTGKITGKVSDAKTGEPLVGVNVMVEGTMLGAATDVNGDYVILNVPPGVYVLKVSMIGYKILQVKDVRVGIDLTTRIDFKLEPTVLEIPEAITVVAERPLVRFDITSSQATVGREEIEEMPIEEFEEALILQAGVVQGSGGEIHIRGGRSSEIAYLVDGISVTDPFSSRMAVEIENNAIQELQMISGTFNAEYGQAMSGIVNIVTKEGGLKNYGGKISLYLGDYLSSDTSTFFNIDERDLRSLNDLQFSLSGPLLFLKNRASFHFSGRYFFNEGYLYGKRIFYPNSFYFDKDSLKWILKKSGDGKIIPMNPSRQYSLQGKLAYNLSSGIKITVGAYGSKTNYRTYYHKFKYNPDGDYKRYRENYNIILTWTHAISPRTFYAVKYSNFFNYYKHYVHELPEDSSFYNVDPRVFNAAAGYKFYIGGLRMGHYYRNSLTKVYKAELTSQINTSHQIKTGIESRWNRIHLKEFTILYNKDTNWKPQIPKYDPEDPSTSKYKTSPYYDIYTNYPNEISFYLQDKIELVDMIVNVGIRYERFEPDGKILADPEDPNYRSPIKPANKFHDYNGNGVQDEGEPDKTDKERLKYWFKKAKPKHQISPRIGISYPITDKGALYFSYGHFLQIPPYEYLYINPEFEVTPGLSTTIGNADLEPQRTVQYEVGLQQQILENTVLDITGFYKDIRNLLGTKIVDTFIAGDRYALYINRDYGNVRGITISLRRRRSSYLSASLDYTYSIAEGNASDPASTYYDELAGREPEKQLVYLSWDQTHTLNISVILSKPESWGLSLVGQYGSGLPYTPSFAATRTSFENSERKPARYNLDLRAHKEFKTGKIRYSLFLNIYNLFDRRNEDLVYTDTGRSTYTLIPTYTPQDQGYNTLDEYLRRPDYYSSPRLVKIGMAVSF